MMRLQLSTQFSPDTYLFLTRLGQAAEDWGARAYLVGGMPRDLIRGESSIDLDLALEGDAIAFSKELKQQWGKLFGNLQTPSKHLAFKRYGTAKLLFVPELFSGVASIDFATARREIYPKPGGAPAVDFADLQADLARRDFSINAIAISLSPTDLGAVLDPHGGVAHLREGQIKVLHAQSFIDDPARLIRAVRFATRLGYRLESTTSQLFAAAVAEERIKTLPDTRLAAEFRKALAEPKIAPVLLELEQSGLLQQIIPGIKLDQKIWRALEQVDVAATDRSAAANEIYQLLTGAVGVRR